MNNHLSVKHLIDNQRIFFHSGKTNSFEWRVEALRNLRKTIVLHKEQIVNALFNDLKKSPYAAQRVEIDQIISEIDTHIQSLKQWMNPQKVKTPLIFFPTTSFIVAQPRGIVLIISPWNFPFSLTLRPLIGAISAGNCALLKPSEFSPHSANILQKIISSVFDPEYIALVQGDAQVAQEILTQRFDYIFFTGSTRVGKLVMQAAAHYITPLTLELGGCNPCIVDNQTDMKIAAHRIAWGKFHNAGQSCLAPNYVAADKKIKKEFTQQLIHAIKTIYSNKRKIGSIISEFHFDRLSTLLEQKKIIYGEKSDRTQLFIPPTLIETTKADPLLNEEIFGPVLPIFEYESLKEVIGHIYEQPLALYLFTTNETVQKQIIDQTSSGAVCINDVGVHYANNNLPFGGVGMSGFGSYHGKKTFDTFTHFKPVMKRSFWFDWSFRYKI